MPLFFCPVSLIHPLQPTWVFILCRCKPIPFTKNIELTVWLSMLWIFLIWSARPVLFSLLYFDISNFLLRYDPLYYDLLASIGYARSTLSRLVFIHLPSLHFSCIYSPPSDHLCPIRSSSSISSLLNSDISNIYHSTLHCLLISFWLAWVCLSLLSTFHFFLK